MNGAGPCPVSGRRARSSQDGALALLAALLLAVLMAAGGLAAARNTTRELAQCGIQARAAEASAAADSGLEWFRAWAAGPGAQAFLAGLAPGAEAEAPVPVNEDFRVRLRHLGAAVADPETPAPVHWLVTSVGTSRTGKGYRQVRQALTAAGPGLAPRLLVWLPAAAEVPPPSHAKIGEWSNLRQIS